ncbi:hypothetical protein MMC07_006474 [Pseudocyphellaria aurata]|nr:hypothetical protein [Pseudocyphellaria aurata]
MDQSLRPPAPDDGTWISADADSGFAYNAIAIPELSTEREEQEEQEQEERPVAAQQNHQHNSNGQHKDHVCHLCGHEFGHSWSLLTHIKTLHSPNPRIRKVHYCHVCRAGYDRKEAVARHIKNLHGSNPPHLIHVCRLCGAEYASQAYLDHHTSAEHTPNGPPRNQICHVCGARFTKKWRLNQHIKDRHESNGLNGCKTLGKDPPAIRIITGCLRTKPPLSGLGARKRVQQTPRHGGTSPPTPAGNLKSVLQCASQDLQNSADSRSSSVIILSPSRAPAAPELQADQTRPPYNKAVIFHFFLADEQNGAIPLPFDHCKSVDSFFDEAQAAWGTLGEEQHPPRMSAVNVAIERVRRPIFVLWKNDEGFERMMKMISEQAAKKQTKLNVEAQTPFHPCTVIDPLARVFCVDSVPFTLQMAKEYSLPSLPYGYDGLAPHISKQIMTLHHTKHHQAYVTNLNAALKSQAAAASGNDIVTQLDLQAAIRFNAGGHINHSLFWENLAPASSPSSKESASPKLIAAVEKRWGSLAGFKAKFGAVLVGLKGSGWGWLVQDEESGQLQITTTKDQDPVAANQKPLLGVDMWEHAYYLQYFNDKKQYTDSIWHVINWQVVEKRFTASSNEVWGALKGLKASI